MAMAASNDQHGKTLVSAAYESNVDLKPTFDFGWHGNVSIFHVATDLNMIGTMSLIMQKLDREDVVKRQNNQGFTPLEVAAVNGHKEMLAMLVPGSDTSDETLAGIMEAAKAKKERIDGESAKQKEASEKEAATVEEKDKKDTIEEKAKEELEKINAMEISEDAKKQALSFKDSGNEHFVKQEWEKAVEFYSKAIASDPSNAAFYSNRSACYVQLKKLDEALHDAVLTRHLRPDWPKGAYRLAVARLELGRYEDAALAAWEGVQLDESNEEMQSFFQKCVKRGRKAYVASQKKS